MKVKELRRLHQSRQRCEIKSHPERQESDSHSLLPVVWVSFYDDYMSPFHLRFLNCPLHSTSYPMFLSFNLWRKKYDDGRGQGLAITMAQLISALWCSVYHPSDPPTPLDSSKHIVAIWRSDLLDEMIDPHKAVSERRNTDGSNPSPATKNQSFAEP